MLDLQLIHILEPYFTYLLYNSETHQNLTPSILESPLYRSFGPNSNFFNKNNHFEAKITLN